MTSIWNVPTFKQYVCLDNQSKSPKIGSFEKELKEHWNYTAETASDEIESSGLISRATGKSFRKKENGRVF